MKPTKPSRFLVSCEHGGNRIPSRYRPLFRGFESLLRTHRGYDAGALTMARDLAGALAAPLFAATTSRLLIDLNRSLGHPKLYSEATRAAPAALRLEILARHYLAYRGRVEEAVAAAPGGGRVVHISAHSFTPVLDGRIREADLGLLYDPERPGEVELCRRWQAACRALAPELRVRRNYPYRGRSDGLTAHLRRRFPAERYLGIELEINQRHVFADGRRWRALRRTVIAALLQALSVPDAPAPRGLRD
ncbi:N-formylglutamate amidohydrolase [mine drainage metagenome]|uniref:N-formylglutamate amidohydrolase n=1 Tax=mine drainage metagenome TaxID=410659 RepID=A0A1J5RJB7_9ZZZZ